MNFKYTEPPVPENCTFKISPSSIAKFFDMPVIWYKEQMLGEKVFTGNTATRLGTIIHAVAEAVALGEPASSKLIEEYLSTIDDPEVDLDLIRSLYQDMSHVLINKYVLHNMPDIVEQSVSMEISEGIYLAGTYDAIQGSTIIDYKNVSKKPNTETIPFMYKIQLLSYARASEIDIDRIRIVYTVRPTKTLPARVFVVTHMITPEDWKLIDDTLLLIAETVQLSRTNPEYTHLLFKSMNLKV